MISPFKNNQVEIIKSKENFIVPDWPCPSCNIGILEEKGIKIFESNSSKSNRSNQDWEPDWINGSALGQLKCNKRGCEELVNFVGEYRVREDQQFDEQAGYFADYYEVIKPKYFDPPITIIPIHKAYPDEIKNELRASFNLYWNDPESCANKIRNCVEKILTDYKIPRFSKSKKYLALHHRIEKLRGDLESEKPLLMALKVIANPGSHGEKIHLLDLVNAFEILDHVLDKIYRDEEDRIKKVSKRYLKKRRKKP